MASKEDLKVLDELLSEADKLPPVDEEELVKILLGTKDMHTVQARDHFRLTVPQLMSCFNYDRDTAVEEYNRRKESYGDAY